MQLKFHLHGILKRLAVDDENVIDSLDNLLHTNLIEIYGTMKSAMEGNIFNLNKPICIAHQKKVSVTKVTIHIIEIITV